VDNTEQFNCISLCTGYGGLELGLRRVIANLRTICYVEIEAFACANLVSKIEQGRLDAAPIWTDIKSFNGKPFRNQVHIITGGYPCQPFSVAGKRQGTDDPRHLWPYIERIIEAVRPVWCFFENVSGHLIIGYPEVYRSLRNLGYYVEAGLFTACECISTFTETITFEDGETIEIERCECCPHKRERLFILANNNGNGRRTWSRRNMVSDTVQFTQRNTTQGQITGELADTTDNGLPGQQQGSIQERQFNTIQEQPEHRGPGRSQGCRWPSRPGQPQYEWEEPRVVGNSTSKRLGRRGKDDTRKQTNLHRAKSKQDETEGQTKPRLGRAANGPASRVDRLRLLGNGVVPQCAELAFRTLIQLF